MYEGQTATPGINVYRGGNLSPSSPPASSGPTVTGPIVSGRDTNVGDGIVVNNVTGSGIAIGRGARASAPGNQPATPQAMYGQLAEQLERSRSDARLAKKMIGAIGNVGSEPYQQQLAQARLNITALKHALRAIGYNQLNDPIDFDT